MKRVETTSQKIRRVVANVSMITGALSFVGMYALNLEYAGWRNRMIVLLVIFIISLLVGVTATDPKWFNRRMFANFFCIMAFSYKWLGIRNECTRACYRIKKKYGTYYAVYAYAMNSYDFL